MALNLSPEHGVKLTKKDRAHVLKKMKQGWRATCLIPDYTIDESGDIQIASNNNRRVIKKVKVLEDGIHIENALKNKTLRIQWFKIIELNDSKEMKEGLEIKMNDGKYVSFSMYTSYKSRLIKEFVANYISDKRKNLF